MIINGRNYKQIPEIEVGSCTGCDFYESTIDCTTEIEYKLSCKGLICKLDEEKITIDNKVYKKLPEESLNSCYGCAFTRGSIECNEACPDDSCRGSIIWLEDNSTTNTEVEEKDIIPTNRIKEIKLKINNYQHRENMIVALAEAGYKVHVEEENIMLTTNYYVVFEYNNDSK